MKKYVAVLLVVLGVLLLLGRIPARAVPVFSEVSVDTGNGFGSTGTFALRFANIDVNTGSAITYSQSSVNGDSFTVNMTGVYGISYSDGSTSGDVIAVTVNGSPSTSFSNLSAATVLCRQSMQANFASSCGVSVVLTSGDVIRAHRALATDGGTNSSARFIIVKIL